MTVTNSWTDPSEGGALDRDAGQVLTDAIYDGICSDLLYLGGTAGTRLSHRSLWGVPITYHNGSAYAVTEAYNATPAAELDDAVTTYARMSVYIPSDFGTLVSANVVVMGAATGTAWVLADTQYAAVGQAANTHSSTGTLGGLALTSGIQTNYDISSQLSGLAADDMLGVNFKREGGHASDVLAGSVWLFGLRLIYSVA